MHSSFFFSRAQHPTTVPTSPPGSLLPLWQPLVVAEVGAVLLEAHDVRLGDLGWKAGSTVGFWHSPGGNQRVRTRVGFRGPAVLM